MAATRYNLQDLIIFAEKPRVIISQPTRATVWFWFPALLRFATGELMCNVSLNPDLNTNNMNTQAVSLSTDNGLTFDQQTQFDVNGFHNGGGEPRISLADGSIVGCSAFVKPKPLGQTRVFSAHRWTYSRGGRSYQVEPWGATITGFPRDVVPLSGSRVWWAQINWFGNILEDRARNRWISTISVTYQGDDLTTTVAVVSYDLGRNWVVAGTIATPDQTPGVLEGFDEASMVQLASGELMCISRVGSAEPMWRSYSTDGGATWSTPVQLSMGNKAPKLLRLSNGVIVLTSGGVTGLEAWFSLDSRAAGSSLQNFGMLAHHNAQAALFPSEIRSFGGSTITTSYSSIVEVSPNRLFCVYDLLPVGRNPNDASVAPNEIYLMELGVVRTDGLSV